MATHADLMTVEQYYEITHEGDKRHLVGGAIVVNETTWAHWRIQQRIVLALSQWAAADPARGEAVGPIDVKVSEHDLYGPDISYYRRERVPADLYSRPYELPDLCVEIRSPSTWRYDLGAKKSAYEAAGLPELWLVDDAARTVLVYRRSAPDAPAFDVALELSDTLTSPLLDGFALDVPGLFA